MATAGVVETKSLAAAEEEEERVCAQIISRVEALSSGLEELKLDLVGGYRFNGRMREQLAAAQRAVAEATVQEQTVWARALEAERKLADLLEGMRRGAEEFEVEQSRLRADRDEKRRLRLEAEGVSAGLAIEVGRSKAALVELGKTSDSLRKANAKLSEELAMLQGNLGRVANDHELVTVAVGLVYNELEMAPLQEPGSLAMRIPDIAALACEMASDVLYRGVHRAFAIGRTHYEDIDLESMSQVFAPGYTNDEIDQIEAEVTPLARHLDDLVGKDDAATDAAEDATAETAGSPARE